MEDKTKGSGDIKSEEPKEKQIDILAMAYKLWVNKKVILIWCLWGVLAGLIIAFSIPREYTTQVKLAPEARSRTSLSSGGLGALASMAGLATSANTTTDAVYPQLYPDIVGSTPFALSLLNVTVEDKNGNKYTVEEFLNDKTKRPWWKIIMGAPYKLVSVIRGGGNKNDVVLLDSLQNNNINNHFKLSSQEDALVNMLRGRVRANIDQKTNVITIQAEMQDPMVSAILADTVVSRLRDFVTDYRTNKARNDLEYALKINEEAQQDYYNAQQRLAEYADRNQSLATQSARITRERLENESSLAFNVYNQTALQVQTAKSKVQETTPVYTVLTPPTVPLRPTSPRKGLIIGGFTFLAFAASCAWILFAGPVITEYKKKSQSDSQGIASE